MCEAMMFPDTVEEWMEEYKIVDTDHVYSNGIEYVPIFRMKQWFENCRNKSITTNADRIRAMSDEELADWLCHIVSNETVNCSHCIVQEYCKMGRNGFKEWLKQEAKT